MHSLETIYVRNAEQVKLAFKRAMDAGRWEEAANIQKANLDVLPRKAR